MLTLVKTGQTHVRTELGPPEPQAFLDQTSATVLAPLVPARGPWTANSPARRCQIRFAADAAWHQP